ncbi:hypothetical protein ACFSTE_15265 [Aquimarina hainanensis]|uniref:Lipoprotein n=1 Tax=Aquimarina hainanensis TaxID=1578017 RepID=A0ABW5NAD1_9FLAO
MKNLDKREGMNLIINNKLYLILIAFLVNGCHLVSKNGDEYFKLELSKNPKVNSKIYGEFEYSSQLDTLHLGDKDYRSIRLYLGIFKREHTIQELKTVKLDTFVPLNDNEKKIPFYLEFKEKGSFIIDGYVEDIVFLNNYYKDGKTRILSNEAKVKGSVQVIDEK